MKTDDDAAREAYEGQTPGGTPFTLAPLGEYPGRWTLSIPAIGLPDAVVAETVSPEGIPCIRTISPQRVGGKSQYVAAPITPEVRAWMDEADAPRKAALAVQDAKREASRLAQERPLLARMHAEEARLVSLIPEGNIRVNVTEIPSPYGDPTLQYRADGTSLSRSTPGLVHHGNASATRPGAGIAFAMAYVYSIPREALEAARAEQQAAAARAAAKGQRMEQRKADTAAKIAEAFALAAKTGQRHQIGSHTEECNDPDCSLDIVTAWAMPDGSMKSERIHTH